MARQQPGGTQAMVALRGAGAAFSVHEFAHDPGERNYGLAAAAAIGAPPSQVFKTLLALVDSKPVVGIVAVDRQLSLKSLAGAFGAKRAEMMEPAAAERLTGYVVGGISPFGQKRVSPTVLDDAAAGFEVIYVSGGRRGLDLEVAPQVLLDVLGARLASIAQ